MLGQYLSWKGARHGFCDYSHRQQYALSRIWLFPHCPHLATVNLRSMKQDRELRKGQTLLGASPTTLLPGQDKPGPHEL